MDPVRQARHTRRTRLTTSLDDTLHLFVFISDGQAYYAVFRQWRSSIEHDSQPDGLLGMTKAWNTGEGSEPA